MRDECWLWEFAAILGLACWIIGCGGTEASTGQLPADFCFFEGGGENIRLVAQSGSVGGSLPPGSQVMHENGIPFLIVDEQCRFWVHKQTLGDVRSGTLNTHMLRSLWEHLQLAHWSEYAGQYGSQHDQGTWWRFQYDGSLVGISVNGLSTEDAKRIAWLLDGIRASVGLLHEHGDPVGGSVRFVLVDDSEAGGVTTHYEDAAYWPLPEPAASWAVSVGEANLNAAARRVDGADADSLRQTVDRYRNAYRTLPGIGFVPVKDDVGGYYQLYLRDMLPFEDDQGLWEFSMGERW